MKPWDGRFKEKTHPLIEKFTSSINTDWILYPYDIEGSKAYAEMLQRIGIIKDEEKEKIIEGLDKIKKEIEEKRFKFQEELEDIHMHIESSLIEKIGDAGKKLHTGRSRNDQVVTDVKLYLKNELSQIDKKLLSLLRTLIMKAEAEKDTIMPGYTHLQRAQVITFAHYLLAYYFMLKRDRERIKYVNLQVDVLPLGSSAIAGSTLPLDRLFLKERLGFSKISENSLDTVSERDFILEALFCLSMIMIHLSRLSEDLILFSTEEFSFLELPDSLCTGSSLMPHKKNPDALELVRGKTSRVVADLFSLFLLLKGLPSSYNRDLQEDKGPLFHAIETTGEAIEVMDICVREMNIKRNEMKKAVYEGFISATEMAEYLVLRGMPFRDAHRIVGEIVKECIQEKRYLQELKLEELRKYSALFEEDIFEYIDPYNILKNRKTKGSSSTKEVERKIEEEKIYLSS